MNSMNLSKSKPTQNDLRLLMNLKKRKLLESANGKIDSPLAKCQDNGTYLCILCNAIVKNKAMWNEHVGCKQHRDNITRKKSLSDSTSIVSASKKCLSKNIFKRHADSSTDSPKPKILRGILKNKAEIIVNDGYDYAGSIPIASSFSSECEPSTSSECKMDIDIEEGAQIDSSTGLPEGFFDDPHQDAKARNVDYKDPKEEEWEKFQREIREQTALSTQLQEEDQVEASTDRIIEEIDEQMHNWSRMLSLEIKKEKIHESRNQVTKDQDDDSSYGSEEEFEEFLDWRTKSSFM